VDGSAKWIRLEKTVLVHSWWSNFGRIIYMYQEEKRLRTSDFGVRERGFFAVPEA
jgi:hypothetical protein